MAGDPGRVVLFQICVEKCPDKFMTLLKAYANPSDMDYYKKFCKPEFAGMTKLVSEEEYRAQL